MLGIDGKKAAQFSFLLAIPAILGATLLEGADLIQTGIAMEKLKILAVGTSVSFVSGYAAIKILLDIVRRGKLYWFAPYCLAVGILGILYL